MGHQTRKPTSNDIPSSGNGGLAACEVYNGIMDDFAITLNGLGKRCKKCKLVAYHRNLNKEQICKTCNSKINKIV